MKRNVFAFNDIRYFCRMSGLCLILVCAAVPALAQDASPPPAAAQETAPAPAASPAAPSPATAEAAPAPVKTQLTLMDMIQHGGNVLYVILALGFFAVVWALYLLFTVTVRREVPPSLSKRARAQIRAGELREAYLMCEERDELLANVLGAGLKMAGHDRFLVQEAMESEGERGAAVLWQRISYLNNMATLATLLGLLGTVWGMMLAFGSIALNDAQVKTLSMAYSVSTAMVTTAAGLAIAIPAMAVYFFLRGQVLKIVASVEMECTDLVDLIAEQGQRE